MNTNAMNTTNSNSSFNNTKSGASDLKDEIKKTTDEVKDAVKDGVSEAKKMAFDAKDAVEDGAKDAKRAIGDAWEKGKDKISDIKKSGDSFLNTNKIKDSLSHCTEEVGKKCKASTDAVRNKITNEPVKSALIISAVSFILGRMFRNR